MHRVGTFADEELTGDGEDEKKQDGQQLQRHAETTRVVRIGLSVRIGRRLVGVPMATPTKESGWLIGTFSWSSFNLQTVRRNKERTITGASLQ